MKPHAPIVVLLAALSFAPTGHAQTPAWSQFASSPTSLLLNGNTPRDDDVHFVDPLHGWVARATDGLYRTTNGGITFDRIRSATNAYPGTNLVAHFRSINFASTTRGWAGNLGPGSYDGSVTDTNLLYETFDGGNSWTPVPGIHRGVMDGFCAIHALDAQHIYGVGRVRGEAHVAISVNGGTNWSVTNLTDAGVMGGLMDVHFRDANNGFVVGMDNNPYTNNCAFANYHGAIARTTNGGASWQVVASTPVNCSYFWKMSWPSTNVGYASLQQNATENTIIFFKTIDGGATWTSNGIPHTSIGVSAGQSWFVQGIGFATDTEGWMGGSVNTGLTFNQCFIRTTDGGLTWSPAGYNNTRGMNRIRFLNSTFGYGSGQRIHIYRVPLAVSAPTNQSVAVGATASFAVTGQGVAPLAYQWRRNSANLSGATASSLSIVNVQPTNAGNYDVVVSDYSGSLTSSIATLTISGGGTPPTIVTQPQGQFVYPGSNVIFTVAAAGTAPFSYQWRRDGANLAGATNSTLSFTNVQLANAAIYSVRVTNIAGQIISGNAVLGVAFSDTFEARVLTTTTNAMTTNGYKIFWTATSGPSDFRAVIGYNYGAVTFPTNIPSAPNSTPGTTKGLLLALNKDATAAISAVNLYPTGVLAVGNFSLKFDLWLNWAGSIGTTEHALFGVNHSGTVTNQISVTPSDGLFFAVDGDGGVSPLSTAQRDYSVFRGGAGSAPVLLTTNDTTFGPAPLLGAHFDNLDAGFTNLFPSQTIAGFGTTPAGSAGLRWLQGEVRQQHQLVTCLLNGVAFAQYTNSYGYTNGAMMIGLADFFSSIGNTNNFVVFDNLRLEPLAPLPLALQSPQFTNGHFSFSFVTAAYESYTIQSATNLNSPSWVVCANVLGHGSVTNLAFPWTNNAAETYFRVSQP